MGMPPGAMGMPPRMPAGPGMPGFNPMLPPPMAGGMPGNFGGPPNFGGMPMRPPIK